MSERRGIFVCIGRAGANYHVRCSVCGREQLLTRRWFARITDEARNCRYCKDHRDSLGLTPRHEKVLAALVAASRARVPCAAPGIARLIGEPLKGVHQTLRILSRKGLVKRDRGAERLTIIGRQFAEAMLKAVTE